MEIIVALVFIYYLYHLITKNNTHDKSQATSYQVGHTVGKAMSGKSTATSVTKNNDLFTWPTQGHCYFDIVGESHYQKALKTLAGEHGSEGANKNCIATIIPDDNNQYDDKAVRIDIDGLTVGYLDRDDARSFRRRLGAKKLTGQPTLCNALIIGGYTDKKGEVMSYGVKLDIKEFQ